MKKKEKEPKYIKSPMGNPMPNYKVYVPGKMEGILVSLVLFLVGGAAGLIFYGGLFKADGEATNATRIADAVVFAGVGLVAVKSFFTIYIQSRLNKQKHTLKLQFKDMLLSLSASISAGSNIQSAFENALNDLKIQYKETDFVVREMQEILSGVAQNINFEVMIRDFGNRSDNEDVVAFADVFEICYRKGGSMQSVIQRTYQLVSEKTAVADEIETKLTSNKMQHNAMSIMPIVVVAMLKFTNDTFAENFATPVGIIVNVVAMGIFIASYRYGLKICDVKV